MKSMLSRVRNRHVLQTVRDAREGKMGYALLWLLGVPLPLLALFWLLFGHN